MGKTMRGSAISGYPQSDPIDLSLRILAVQLLAQAVRDAKSGQPRVRRAALAWLNSEEGRGIAGTFKMAWAQTGQPITEQDLPPRLRSVYHLGG